jgi:2'-5' RNA ligase
MVDHWKERAEPGPSEAQFYWHILMRDQPQIRALAAVARQRLAEFGGLHFTPEQWLHLSVFRVGPSTDIAPDDVNDMICRAGHLLKSLPPVTVKLGQVLFHPEAIALGVRPADALDAISLAVRKTAADTLALPAEVVAAPWIPHVTVAYSTADQDAGPIIAALGRELPECPVTIDMIHLIAQQGPERDWNWKPVATATIGS